MLGTYTNDALGRRAFRRCRGTLPSAPLLGASACDHRIRLISLPRSGIRNIRSGQIAAEYLWDGETETFFARIHYGNGIDEPLAMMILDVNDVNGNFITNEYLPYAFHRDTLGTITHLTDENGDIVERYECTPFGKTTIYTGTGPDGLWNTADDVAWPSSRVCSPFMFRAFQHDEESRLYTNGRGYSYAPDEGRPIAPGPTGWGSTGNRYTPMSFNPAVPAVDLQEPGDPDPKEEPSPDPGVPPNPPDPPKEIKFEIPDWMKRAIEWAYARGYKSAPGGSGFFNFVEVPAWKPHAPGDIGSWDLDGDGKADVYGEGIDTNGDGKVDGVDTTGDRKVDQQMGPIDYEQYLAYRAREIRLNVAWMVEHSLASAGTSAMVLAAIDRNDPPRLLPKELEGNLGGSGEGRYVENHAEISRGALAQQSEWEMDCLLLHEQIHRFYKSGGRRTENLMDCLLQQNVVRVGLGWGQGVRDWRRATFGR